MSYRILITHILFLLITLLFPTRLRAATSPSIINYTDQGVITINTERFFPLGIYFAPGPINQVGTWQKIAQTGLNVSISEARLNRLDWAQQNNIYLFASFTYHDASAWETMVSTAKNHPALLGWYGHDEPCIFPYSQEDLTRHEKLSSTLDPSHPIYVYNYCTYNIRPVFDGHGSIAGSGTVHGGTIRSYAQDASIWHQQIIQSKIKSSIVNIHASSTTNTTADSMLDRALAAIAGGANGLTWFDEACERHPELGVNCDYNKHLDKIKFVTTFLRSIYPGLIGTQPRYTIQNNIYTMSRLGTDNLHYLVIANTGPQNISHTLDQLPPLTQFGELRHTSHPTFTSNSSGQISLTVPANSIFVLRSLPTPSPSPSPSVTFPGDLNNDGHVNLLDFNLLVSRFGISYTLSHYNQLLANYGQ